MGDHDPPDDVAAALLGDSTYDRLRVTRYRLFDQSVPRKLTLQGLVFAALALVYPLASTMPASTRDMFAGGDPLASTPKILLLGAWAGAIETTAALGLVYVGVTLHRNRGDLDERQARRLLTVEDVASMVALVTGAVAILVLDGFFLLGHAGPTAISTFLEAGGQNPYAATPIPVTVPGVAVPAAVLSVLLLGLGRVLRRA
jgi:hypothetical protein